MIARWITACAALLAALMILPARAQAPLPTLETTGEAIVARVNDQPITLGAFQRALLRRLNEAALFNNLPADTAALEADVLDRLIEQALIEQGAAAQQITVSDAEVLAELQLSVELAGSSEAWSAWLETNLYTADEFLSVLRATLLTNQVRDALTADLAGDVPQVHARHILVRAEADALNILAALQAGQDFAALAAAYSLDETTRAQGGDLGWFTREELLAPELAAAAFALAPGQISQPVLTALGYHVVQTLEAASRPVEPERSVYIAQARFENWLQTLKDAAVIEKYL